MSHWNALRGRLLLDSRAAQDRCGYRSFPYGGNRFSGIIAYLTERYGGNVHDRAVVEVTANRPANGNTANAPRNAVDLDNDASYFCSANEKDQSICSNFKEMKVRPTHYSIRSHGNARNGEHLRNWVVEGSQDGGSWTVIDCRDDTGDLNRAYGESTFAVSRLGTFRMIQLRQTGPNHQPDNYLYFTKFEIFGWLIGLK